MKEKEKKQSKQHIQSLAELCVYEIYENKFLISQKERYTSQINLIKQILIDNSKLVENNNNSKKQIIINEQIKNIYNTFISKNFQLKKEQQKILSKYNKYKEDLLKEDSMNRQTLSNIQYDNFILIYQLKEKDDIIKSIQKGLDSLKDSLYFKENKREQIRRV